MTRVEGALWVLGGIGVIGAIIGAFLAPDAFFGAWLAAMVAWLGWPLGSIALLLTHALTGGRWGDAIRPALRTGALTLPLLLPALVPWAFGLHHLYPWIRPEEAQHLSNHFYLNARFLAVRFTIYIVVWFGLAFLALRGRGLWRIAPPGLIVLAFSFTFATIDLTESIDPKFASSAYGMIAAAAAGLFALAIAVLIAGATLPPKLLADLGRLLLGLTILWAYLDFVQMLIVWESDLVSDSTWYVLRSKGGWGTIAGIIALLHFVLPFAMLIFTPLQKSRGPMMAVAGLLVAMEVLRNLWLVLPGLPHHSAAIQLACVAVFGGCTAAFVMRRRTQMLAASHV
jgi:hypothetical protein